MRSVVIALLALLLCAPAAQARPWLRPVDGELLRGFALGPHPYARGQHRGADLAAPPGAIVRSACAGLVSFAGRVPRGAGTVSVRCGELVATYQQLGTVVVRAGRRVAAGTRLGTVGRSGDPRTPRAHVHLGAREAATGRYVDPLALLGSTPVTPALPLRAPPAIPPAPPRPALPRPALPRPALPSPAERPRGPAAPWPVWAGLASIALALPVGGLVRLRGRRRRVAGRRAAVAR